MPLKKSVVLAAAISAGLLLSLPAAAQFAKAEDAVKYRQGALDVMATHFGRIGAMVKGDLPFDAKAAQDNAQVVLFMSRLPWAGFTPGSDAHTKAKPEIWKEKAKFDDLAKKMEEEIAKLDAAAKTGSLDNIKTAFGDAGKTCKNCHDSYRSR